METKKIATTVKEPYIYKILQELQLHCRGLYWMGTGQKPAWNIPYRELNPQAKIVTIDHRGQMAYWEKTDETMTLLSNDEFLNHAKVVFKK